MNTPIRARHDARGFSFVELLVTVVIAGIVFAAMVPLFAGAQQKASGDQMRNIALNVAQDRIEKIRALSYSQITKANLDSSTFMKDASAATGPFGTTYAATSGGGGTKAFTVVYTVTEAGAGSAWYKKVDVDVSWTGPPFPVKHAKLTTFVSKQYAGPQISSLALSPMNAAGEVTGKPVVMTVTISSSDYGGMVVNGSLKGKVIFDVFSAVNGTKVGTYTVNTGDAGNTVAGSYTASWDAAGAADGDYTFRAQAFNNASATSPDAGNVFQRTATVILTGAPPKVTGVTTSPGDGRVTLSWTSCAATDFDHYEVWMGTAPGAETNLGLGQYTATSYIKTGLTNDDTYYFVIYAVDKDGNKSPASDEVAETPTSKPGVNRPSTPGSFAGVATFNTAVLTWTASTQDGTSTLAGYYIYRDDMYTPFASVGAAAVSFPDLVGWSTSHTYMIRAYNTDGRKSVRSGTVSVSTLTIPGPFTMTLSRSSKSISTTVTCADPAYASAPQTGSKTMTLSGLYYGVYTVTSTWAGHTTNVQTISPLSANTTVTISM